MSATITYLGETFRGLAYCKRYHFQGEPIRYWGYRFVHGTVDDYKWSLWTADATFGFSKHAYFRTIDTDGRVLEAGPRDSCHRDDHCYGEIDGTKYDVELESLGVWDTVLRSPEMDTQLRQRFLPDDGPSRGAIRVGLRYPRAVLGYAGLETAQREARIHEISRGKVRRRRLATDHGHLFACLVEEQESCRVG